LLRPEHARFALFSLGIGVLLAATGCASSDDDPAAEDEAALINGAVAAPATFPATLNIEGNCTVTRIGEKLLLSAAHCVRTDRGAITPAFAPQSKLAVRVRGARPGPRQLTVIRTTISGRALRRQRHGLENTRTNYELTPGPRDSGGALYRTGTNRVVGVNASYTFLPASNVPVTNWHTRLDGDARWGVASWLAAFGARLSRPARPRCAAR